MSISISNRSNQKFSPAEISVIDYINKNSEKAIGQTITELADASYTSPATVSRAIRKCGFAGIPELRHYISLELGHTEAPYRMNEVLELSYKECTMTIESLRIHDILEIVRLIKQAKRIYVLARGLTGLMAEEFRLQLQLQNYTALPITDSELMKRIDKLLIPGDLVLIFTAYNSTPEFAIAAKKAREIGCTVVVCCCKQGTSLEELADIFVYGYSLPIVEGNEFNVASRLPLQIISRTIIEYLAR